jgi:hypothetical protein
MARGDENGGRRWLVAGGVTLLLLAVASGSYTLLTILIGGGVGWLVARLRRSSDKVSHGRRRDTTARGTSRTGLTAHHMPLRPRNPRNVAVQRRYFALMRDLEDAKSRGDFDRALASASASVEMLPQFVEAWKRDQEGIGGEASFDLSSIPAIDTLCQLGPARGEIELLEQARSYLAHAQDLRPWVEKLDRAIEDATAAVTVVKRVADEPGLRQAGLARSMGLDGHRVRSTLY